MARRLNLDARLYIALGSFTILGLVAVAELEGFLRVAVLLLLALLAGKTLIHAKDEPME